VCATTNHPVPRLALAIAARHLRRCVPHPDKVFRASLVARLQARTDERLVGLVYCYPKNAICAQMLISVVLSLFELITSKSNLRFNDLQRELGEGGCHNTGIEVDLVGIQFSPLFSFRRQPSLGDQCSNRVCVELAPPQHLLRYLLVILYVLDASNRGGRNLFSIAVKILSRLR